MQHGLFAQRDSRVVHGGAVDSLRHGRCDLFQALGVHVALQELSAAVGGISARDPFGEVRGERGVSLVQETPTAGYDRRDSSRQAYDLAGLHLPRGRQEVGRIAVPPAAPLTHQIANDELGVVIPGQEIWTAGKIGVGLHRVEDLLGRLPGVHPRQHLIDDDLQIAGRVHQHRLNGPPPVDHVAVSRKEPLGTQSRHLLESRHPFDRVALNLLGIAAVRGHPEDEVTGEQIGERREPDIAMVISLALRRAVARLDIAKVLHQGIPKGQRGPREPIRKDESRIAGLTPVDVGIQTMRQPIALEVLDAVLLCDDLRSFAGIEECLEAKGVIDVPVRVHGGVQWRVTPGTDRLVDRARGLGKTRVDEQQPHVSPERIGIDEHPV